MGYIQESPSAFSDLLPVQTNNEWDIQNDFISLAEKLNIQFVTQWLLAEQQGPAKSREWRNKLHTVKQEALDYLVDFPNTTDDQTTTENIIFLHQKFSERFNLQNELSPQGLDVTEKLHSMYAKLTELLSPVLKDLSEQKKEKLIRIYVMSFLFRHPSGFTPLYTYLTSELNPPLTITQRYHHLIGVFVYRDFFLNRLKKSFTKNATTA